jgi:hypothetical protein
MSYDGENKRKWHFGKEVSIGDAIGLASAIAAVLIAYAQLDTRVALIEQSNLAQSGYMGDAVSRLEESIREINQKLDRLIERNQR